MKFIVNGAKGRMGAQIVALLKKEDCPHELLAGVDINAAEGDGYFKSLSCVTEKADCIIDFSHHSATKEICEYAVKMSNRHKTAFMPVKLSFAMYWALHWKM